MSYEELVEQAERTGWSVLLPLIERVYWAALYTDEGGEA